MENYLRRLKVSTPIVLEELRSTLKLNVKTDLQFFSINLKIVLAQSDLPIIKFKTIFCLTSLAFSCYLARRFSE